VVYESQELIDKLLKIKILRFACVGGTGAIIKLGILYLFTDIVGFTPALSYVVSFVFAVSSNYFFNTVWTFKDKLQSKALLKYSLVSLMTLGINEGILYILTYRLGVWYMISGVIGILVAFIINYTLSRRIVWKNQYNPIEKQKVAHWQ
jgi:dolichol-phosphate mannosyltransferase